MKVDYKLYDTLAARPAVMSGEVTVDGYRVTVDEVVRRLVAGESVDELANDWNIPPRAVEQCLRLQIAASKARKSLRTYWASLEMVL